MDYVQEEQYRRLHDGLPDLQPTMCVPAATLESGRVSEAAAALAASGAPLDAAEARRLDALDSFEISGTPPEPEFDRIARLAARLLDAPVAMVCLVDERWIWVKGSVGTAITGLPRAGSLCAAAVAAPGVTVVPDVQAHGGHRGGTMEAWCGFFAAAPIVAADGEALGALCVMDRRKRTAVPDQDKAALADLATLVAQQLEHRRRTIALERVNQRTLWTAELMHALAHAPTGDEALASLLKRLCSHHGAATGCVWTLTRPNNLMREVCRISTLPSLAPHTELIRRVGLAPGNSIVADAILAGVPRAVRFAGVADLRRYPMVVSARQHGLQCQVIHPIQVSGEHFAVTLAFNADRADLDMVLDDLGSLDDTIRPALYRKVAEGRMHLLSTALDRANDAVVITEALPHDKGGPRIAYANASFCRATGYEPHEVVGQSPQLLLPVGAPPAALPHPDAAAPASARAEVEQSRKDGSRYWVEMDVTPIAGGGGQRQWISIQRDVTARRLADQARKEREVSNRTLFEASPMPTLVFHRRSLRFLDVNDAAVRQYGWTRAEFLNMSLPNVQVNDEQPAFGTLIAGTRDLDIARRSWTHLRADGSRMQVTVASHALTYACEDAMMAVLQDVTEIEAARRAMQGANLRLADLAAQLQARTTELTEAHRMARLGTWRWQLGAAEATWCEEMHEIVGVPRSWGPPTQAAFLARIHPDDRAAVIAVEEAACAKRLAGQTDFRIMLEGGGLRHCRLDARPVLDETGAVTAMYGYCQDISDRKQAELALLRSEKLKSIGQLTGGIAHDFNNLLTVVTLNLEEALDSLAPDEPLHDILQPAMHAALRGAELTRHLLSYARRATLRPARVRLSAFFRNLHPLLTRTIGRSYDLQVRLGHDGAAFVDPAQLENAILNLVINARDAMPDGGCIQVSTALTAVGPSTSRHAQYSAGGTLPDDLPPGDYLVIRVADHGTGIPPDVLPRVFEPFFTTKDVGRGNGLGLSTVYGFARQSGGIAAITSELGVGTSVRLLLPMVPPDHADGDGAEGPLGEPWQRRGLRALVVDDEADVLAAAARMLTGIGLQVTTAGSAEEALAHLSGPGSFDLLFSDVRLPGPVDGVCLAARACERLPDIKVLLTSGFSGHSAVALNNRDGSIPGEFEFLPKPYTRQVLLNAVAGLLSGP